MDTTEAAPTPEVTVQEAEPTPVSEPEPVPEPETPAPQKSEVSPAPTHVAAQKPSVGAHMREVVRAKKAERLEKIMTMVIEKKIIANHDVRKELDVSDPTVTRYLAELVKAGRLKRTGNRRAARYEPVSQ